MMTAEMRTVLDGLGGLWSRDAFVSSKVGSIFNSSGAQHGGQESTILTFHTSPSSSWDDYCRAPLCRKEADENG